MQFASMIPYMDKEVGNSDNKSVPDICRFRKDGNIPIYADV